MKTLFDAGLLPTVKPGLEMGKKHGLSLSKACEFILGKSLAKNERMSDWNQRPLTSTQLVYASLDAHCMLSILRALLNHLDVDVASQGSLVSIVTLDTSNSIPISCSRTTNLSNNQKKFLTLLQSQGWIKLFST